MHSGKPNSWTKNVAFQSLQACIKDLEEGLQTLDRLLYVSTSMHDLPVAFASNTLYILERFGRGNREYYDKILLPILKQKAEYLHAEGLAQTVWALANADIYDKELWGQLGRLVREKDFNYEVIKNERWSVSQFSTLTGSEHFFERELNTFAKKLFF